MKRLLLFALALLAVPSALGQYTRWDGYLTNAQGQAIQGAQVYILVQPATVSAYSPQAPVFSSVTGGALTQPLRTDGFGHVFAYVTETVNAAACSTLGSLCYTIVYISKSTGQVVLPDQVIGGGGGGTPGTGCVPTGGGPYPSPNGQGEMVMLNNAGTDCVSYPNLTFTPSGGTDSTMWFRRNAGIELDSEVDPSGEQSIFQPTFWRMISSSGNGSTPQLELQVDDSGGAGGGNPLLIEAAAVKDSPSAGWQGINIQPSIGGDDKTTKDMDSILIGNLTGHGAKFRKYHGLYIQMANVSSLTEEAGIRIDRPTTPVSYYCDLISDDGTAARMLLGCGSTHASTFVGPVSAPEVDVTGSGAGVMDATEGASCPTITAGHDILCALTGSGLQLSNNGAAYFTIGAGGGGSSAFSAITGSTNTTAAMVVGTGASIAPTGSGTIQATNIASTITAGTNVTITGAGTVASPYSIASSGGGGGGGAMTLISDQLLGSPAATVTFSSIPGAGTYKHLRIYFDIRCSGAVQTDNTYMQVNGDTSTAYSTLYSYQNNISNTTGNQASVAQPAVSFTPCASALAGAPASGTIDISDFTGTTFLKHGRSISNASASAALGASFLQKQDIDWFWNSTAAITSITFGQAGGYNFITGSRFTLYGIN